MITSAKSYIAILGCLAVLSITVIIFGVMTHTEPGLMRACWSALDTAIYNCDNGAEIMWNRSDLPLGVRTDGYIGEVQSAIDLTNSQVGCDLLRYSEPNDGLPSDISVTSNAPMTPGDHRGGAAWHLRDGGRLRSRIELYAAGILAQRILVHELGHALGLAHDDFSDSIMFPTHRDTDSVHIDMIRFSDSDRSLLRNLYCDN